MLSKRYSLLHDLGQRKCSHGFCSNGSICNYAFSVFIHLSIYPFINSLKTWLPTDMAMALDPNTNSPNVGLLQAVNLLRNEEVQSYPSLPIEGEIDLLNNLIKGRNGSPTA